LHRVFSVLIQIGIRFSVFAEHSAATAGGDLRGLGICHQQAFSRNSGDGISAKYVILRKIALLANLSEYQ